MTVEAPVVNPEIQAAPSGDANVDLPDPDQMISEASDANGYGNLENGIKDDALAEEWGMFAEELAGVRETTDIVVSPPADVAPPVVDGQVEIPAVAAPVVAVPEVQTPAPAAVVEAPQAAAPVVDAPLAVSPPADEPLIPVQPVVEPPAAVVVAPPVVAPVAAPDVAAQTDAVRQQFVAQMVKQYQMSDADAIAFEAAPAETMAKMAANLHVQVLENVMQNVTQQMPGMINQQSVAATSAQANESAFLESWPELQDHQAKVAEVAQQYRALHPNSSRDEAIKSVGFNTLLALGVDPVKAANRLANGFNKPAAAQPDPAPIPHTPGGVGGKSSRGMQEAPSPTVWSEMVDHQEQWQG